MTQIGKTINGSIVQVKLDVAISVSSSVAVIITVYGLLSIAPGKIVPLISPVVKSIVNPVGSGPETEKVTTPPSGSFAAIKSPCGLSPSKFD